jgi:hypothetical protein
MNNEWPPGLKTRAGHADVENAMVKFFQALKQAASDQPANHWIQTAASDALAVGRPRHSELRRGANAKQHQHEKNDGDYQKDAEQYSSDRRGAGGNTGKAHRPCNNRHD